MKKCFLLLIALFSLCSSVFAQNILVHGRVIDTRNDPVIAAGVIIKGTTTGVVTDYYGNFTIACPVNAILVISAISYITVEVSVCGRTNLPDIILQDDEDYPIFYGSFSPLACITPYIYTSAGLFLDIKETQYFPS